MTEISAPQAYWEEKILPWESSRYSRWIAWFPLAWSVRARFRKAVGILRKRLDPSWSVLELACGSGLLAEELRGRCAEFYGIDIAASAISVAEKRVPEFRFKAGDVLTEGFSKADLTIFLGLTDWLDDRGLETLFAKIDSPHLLFSYTDASPWNPYRLYRMYKDQPHKPGTQRARVYTEAQMRALLEKNGYTMERLTKPYLLNPGVLAWARKRE